MSNFLLLAQAADPNNGAAGGGAFLGGLLAFGVFFWVIAIAATLFWLWMLVDVLTSNKDTNEKILWFLVVFFLHILGAIIYFVADRSKRAGTLSTT